MLWLWAKRYTVLDPSTAMPIISPVHAKAQPVLPPYRDETIGALGFVREFNHEL